MLKYEDDVEGAEKLAIDIEEANQKHLQNDAKTTFWNVKILSKPKGPWGNVEKCFQNKCNLGANWCFGMTIIRKASALRSALTEVGHNLSKSTRSAVFSTVIDSN